MAIPNHEFGQITVAKVRNSAELRQVLVDPWLDSETIIIKPNWVSTDPADFTDADTLRMLFEALDSHIIVTESYMLCRSMNLLKDGMRFLVGNKEVNWKWLQAGDGWQWLVENPSWEWFKDGGHWDHLKNEDKAFLDKYGFTDLFEEFNVTYINVTEEVWNGRIADPTEIKRAVESQFKPVHFEEVYSLVPKTLYDLRGSTLISFARLKMYASFTMKNLFGMIPDPVRPWWHGPNHSTIAEAIIDINKIYHSLFNVYGICEALKNTGISHAEGKYEGLYSGKYNIVENLGVLVCGRNLAALDVMLLNLSDPSRRLIAGVNRASIALAEYEFGTCDKEALKEAKMKIGNWLSP